MVIDQNLFFSGHFLFVYHAFFLLFWAITQFPTQNLQKLKGARDSLSLFWFDFFTQKAPIYPQKLTCYLLAFLPLGTRDTRKSDIIGANFPKIVWWRTIIGGSFLFFFLFWWEPSLLKNRRSVNQRRRAITMAVAAAFITVNRSKSVFDDSIVSHRVWFCSDGTFPAGYCQSSPVHHQLSGLFFWPLLTRVRDFESGNWWLEFLLGK